MGLIDKIFGRKNNRENFKSLITRKAIKFNVGGQRPVDGLTNSWFGKISVGGIDEHWPVTSKGFPMKPLCQINLEQLEVLPDNLKEIKFIAVFIEDENEIPIFDNNGDGWLLRSYSSVDELKELKMPELSSTIKPFQLFPNTAESDFPCWEDCPVEIPQDIEDDFHIQYPNCGGLKIGGWPTLIQSQIFSEMDPNSKVEYAFQIDSIAVEKTNLYIGDSGVIYFGIDSSKTGIDKWSMTWQTM